MNKVEYWIDSANYDLETAEAMYMRIEPILLSPNQDQSGFLEEIIHHGINLSHAS